MVEIKKMFVCSWTYLVNVFFKACKAEELQVSVKITHQN